MYVDTDLTLRRAEKSNKDLNLGVFAIFLEGGFFFGGMMLEPFKREIFCGTALVENDRFVRRLSLYFLKNLIKLLIETFHDFPP